MTDAQLWWITLGAGLVVAGVVALLLALILRSAHRTAGTLGDVWIVGQSVANDTLHVDLLRRSAVACENMLASLKLSSEYTRRLRPDGWLRRR